jgi:hypothetical protein
MPKWFLVVLALAIVLGLAGSALAADETAKGKIKRVSIDRKELVVTDNTGKDLTFQLDDNAKVRLADKDVRLNDLKEGDQVEIKYEKKGDKMMAKEILAKRS